LKSLHRPPVTIFTTAYSEYATEAFDLNAVDYLLKPFSFERFLQAVNKAKDQLELRKPTVPPVAPILVQKETSALFFTAKVDGKIQKIYYKEILFIEGMKEYVRVHCTSGRYVILERLRNLEEQLPAEFIWVHKSYIVAKHQVQSLEGNLLQLGSHKIPLSRSRREEVLQAIFDIE
ncbi:MAG: response regulator transcription factor, partial [Phaeodactylibacter sp.]|nr:response regulator transcription factor [Phaeodactylibacter sp.]